MRILNRYVTRDFLTIFLITLVVFTFVLCLGVVLKAIDAASRGISVGLILKVFGLNLPYMLTFSIPVSVLTATLLLFGRLSFDGELTAMKSTGISLWQIVAPILLISVALSLICMSITASFAPSLRMKFRNMLAELGMEDPIGLFEPGRFVDFEKHSVYIGSRDGNVVYDVSAYLIGSNAPEQMIKASSGVVHVAKSDSAMSIDLYDMVGMIDSRNKEGERKSTHVNAAKLPQRFELGKRGTRKATAKVGDMTMAAIFRSMGGVSGELRGLGVKEAAALRMKYLVEINKRLAVALACFAFAMLGIPLGMKSRRKESSIGIMVSLVLVMLFYLFIIIASNLTNKPELRPDLIVWIPVLVAEGLGAYLIHRAN